MPALTPKKIGLLILMCFGIVGLVALTGCGSSDAPADQHEEKKPPVADTPAPAAAPAPDPAPAPAAADTQTQTSDAAPAAAEEEAPAPAAPKYKAECYSGTSQVFGLEHMSDDDFEAADGGWKFTHINGDKTAYFNGPCVIQTE